MTATTFDTLAYAKKMKAAGFTDQQAEAQAEALAEIIDDNIATKKDLEILGHKLTIRLGGMMATGFSILAALIKFGH